MKRLTAWCSGNAYYPKCFEEPCGGMGCNDDKCGFMVGVCNRLAEYEDTGLTPEEIKSLNTFDGSQAVKATAKLQEEQRKHSWISVSEQLPDEPKSGSDIQEYLVTIDGADQSTTLSYIGDGKWRDDDGNWYKVIAWMPKPEPYKPE